MSDIDALSLSGADLFDYVREKTNDIIVDILQVQEICSTRALLCCDDPLSILEYDCDKLADIKRRAVFFLKLGGHAVKNGVKGSMRYLIDKLKEIEKKHTKESKIQQKSTTDQTITVTPVSSSGNSLSSNAVPSSSIVVQPSIVHTQSSISITSTLTCEQRKDNVEDMIQSWYKKNLDEIELIHDLDYKIIVKQNTHNSNILCHIKCDCGTKFALPLRADTKSFQLSSYYKHIRGTKCSMMCKKEKEKNDRRKCQQQQSSSASLPPSVLPTSLKRKNDSSSQKKPKNRRTS
ncbi:unnamed protein product [Didymodactylos carnosus]|uniref:Uncharacterized protein n=1 Tax=Didymodactylos carnosus TaxID=1234261 RepID=A0A814I6F7_9BILA|nr:unnamed protein product [Didymodactylos carnosus]CAF3789155.1 unnamed protein product [Didymodactylos carnosus]CAF4330638.1 unnamed protein product [Didymodactylos carnosus]